ncbi:MAG: hypothetical protein HYV35_12220 [Lentisphaerae bacterium]|nr:hypothetical protein [Lentisphaerota bacterium]
MKPRRFFLFLSFWLAMMATPAWAESFPSRPTLAEMDQMMTLGTASGHAVRERSLALKGNWSALPYSGIRATFFATLQQELQTLAPQYINSISGPLMAGGSNFLYYTLASWRSAAGLNASGFRRYDAEGNPVGYGLAQSADVFRAPAFEEVAAGFRALRWTTVRGPFTYERLTGASYSGKTNWLDSVAEAEANYIINAGDAGPLGVIEATYASSYSPYRTTIRRTTLGIFTLSGWSSATLSHLTDVALYLRAQKYLGTEIGAHNSVFDNNGVSGLTGNLTWDMIDFYTGPFGVWEELAFIEDDSIPERCVDPKLNSNPQGAFRGFYTPEAPTALLKWYFAD